MDLKKVPTGISGFDSLVEGGFNEGQSILIKGCPGSGKTTFALQFIVNGILKYKEPGLIIILKNQIENLKKEIKRFQISIDKFLDNKMLSIIDVSPKISWNEKGTYTVKLDNSSDILIGDKNFNFKEILSIIHSERRRINAKRIIIDSLIPIMLRYSDQFLFFNEFNLFLRSLTQSKITTLIIIEDIYLDQFFQVIPYLTSGVIKFSLSQSGNKRIRYLDILKLSNINHAMNSVFFEINNNGIQLISDKKLIIDQNLKIIY
ncbi:MAG: RAD55 family ATPase [Candidatus Helarchaeota archaeon]